MSDVSDDDLANNYGPTTPAPPKTKAAAARARKPVAGPSTKPPSKAAAKRAGAGKAAHANANANANAIELDDDSSEGIEFVEKERRGGNDDEDEAEVVATTGPAKGASKKAPARAGSAVNGAPKANGAGKGKARAEHLAVNGDAMEVDHDGEAEPDDEPPDQPAQRAGVRGGSKQPPPRGKSGTNSATAARHARENQRLLRDMERLRAQLDEQLEMNKEMAKHRDRLAASLEELTRLRTTEPEEKLKDERSRHGDVNTRKDSLIQELTGQLSKQSPSNTNQSWTLHFLTREAAEEEKRALRDENTRLKDVIKQHNAVVAAKDQQIAELKQEAELTKKELNAEIERSKQLASRPGSVPHAVTPNGPKAVRGEPSNLPVIKLYEDMTNVLITHVAKEPSADWPGIDEDAVSCVYSYNNPEEHVNFSLQFTLRNQFDRPENAPGKEALPRERLVEKVKYIPKNLELEKPELVERLQFFRDPFMFSRDQMTVFLKTLTDTIAAIFEGDEDAAGGPGGEDEPIMVE
ncbi:hypothetical protein GSI_14225 [Ganoderma sinense ZZ0214-1]|uniref:Monopolin complex subunit Csm1/Pcs1 C-terminal domain-containing protein n=1 Tax=Ganoderma sinense ZZ0214-1 TaxID=1077348 RepID=A0A2G8RSJ7_9APHY|nr:hypothetical protein GSI_14225 [Ganoderma sinense ZZ0214-1]